MSVSKPMIASSSVPTLRVATFAAALRDSLSTVITKHVLVNYFEFFVNFGFGIMLSHSALLECATNHGCSDMVVLLLTTLNIL